jgi:hypothetical protein
MMLVMFSEALGAGQAPCPRRSERVSSATSRRCPGCQIYVEQVRCTIEQSGRVTVDDVEELPEQARDELMDALRAFHSDC